MYIPIKLVSINVLLKLVQWLGYIGCNISIMAIAIIIIELEHTLLINHNLFVIINFVNASKPVLLDNRWDIYD